MEWAVPPQHRKRRAVRLPVTRANPPGAHLSSQSGLRMGDPDGIFLQPPWARYAWRRGNRFLTPHAGQVPGSGMCFHPRLTAGRPQPCKYMEKFSPSLYVSITFVHALWRQFYFFPSLLLQQMNIHINIRIYRQIKMSAMCSDAQSCPIRCNPWTVDHQSPSSVHGILHA